MGACTVATGLSREAFDSRPADQILMLCLGVAEADVDEALGCDPGDSGFESRRSPLSTALVRRGDPSGKGVDCNPTAKATSVRFRLAPPNFDYGVGSSVG